MKARIIAGLTLLLLLVGFVWVHNHAFIDITVTGQVGNNLTYTLVKTGGGSSTTVKAASNHIKRLVTAGAYEIYVDGGGKSYVTTAHTGNYLKRSVVQGSLVSEKDRSFVGYNPSPCFNYLNDRLISYECGSALFESVSHIPATTEEPTVTVPNSEATDDQIEGIITLAGETIFLSKPFSEGDGEASHTISKLDAGLNQSSVVGLPELDASSRYKLVAFKTGFLVYTESLDKAYFYSAFGAPAQTITLASPNTTSQLPVALTTDGSRIVTVFSSSAGSTEEGAATEANTKQTGSEIYINDTQTSSKFTINAKVIAATPCAEHKLCVLEGDSVLHVYTIDGTQLVQDYALSNVRDLYQANDKSLVVTNLGVIDLQVADNTGYFSYTFGDYGYCGIQTNTGGYIVCVVDASSNKVALLVDTTAAVSTPYDKQLYKLQRSSGIAAVSAYRNIVFVTPDIQTDGQSFSEAELNRGKKYISAAVQDSGLSTSGLTIVNTTDPF